MKEYTNFYETTQEANSRLTGTIVLYDGRPYYVVAITDHRGDDIFRVYLKNILYDEREGSLYPSWVDNYQRGSAELGQALDTFMEKSPDVFLRKMMNSPKFNKFRPFPLGMCNVTGDGAIYVQRVPARPKMEQGLIRQMLQESPVAGDSKLRRSQISMFTKDFEDCILGAYPSAEDCLSALKDKEVVNNSAAFHREFAFCRGPVDMILLGYKEDIIGILPNRDFSSVRLGKQFEHVYEAVLELDLFTDININ